MFRWVRRVVLFVGLVIVISACVPPVAAQFFVVNTTVDTVDANVGDGVCADVGGQCSLRAAVMEANSDPNTTEIQLTGGEVYTLTLVGVENAGLAGDLDLLQKTYIRSNVGSGQATIDANGLDRVIDVRGGQLHYFEGLILTGGNTATGGGAINMITGLVGVEDTHIVGNTTTSGEGGGILVAGGTLWMEDSAVSGNTASAYGGGISVKSNAYVYQSTFVNNVALSLQAEITVDIATGGGRLQLHGSTVTGTTYGLDLFQGAATISNSVLSATQGCVGFIPASGGNNVASDLSCGLTGTGDQQSAATGFYPLADNGGAVPTRMPFDGSPGIDSRACDVSTLPDARQQARPSGPSCDAGAVEVQPADNNNTPYFAEVSTLTVDEVDGQYATISWSPATPTGNPLEPIDVYQVFANGGFVDFVSAPATSCTLTGLDFLTTYNLSVSAIDTGGQWSGDSNVPAFREVANSFSTGSAGLDGVALKCVDPTDTDNDRIPDAAETNTGVFVDHGNTGSDPNNSDTDGDGIKDGDDTIGTADGLDLGYGGTNPLRQDILLEFDWFDDSISCPAHSHGLSASVLTQVQTMFANAPNVNPDGTTGINLVGDYGQGGTLTSNGSLLAGSAHLGSGVGGTEYTAFKAANFDANRNGYYHYVLLAHSYGTTSSSGQAEINGDDLIVTLNCYGTDTILANTIVHELGHNLSLRHGGDSSVFNYKPNYNSVMNYKYQFGGVDNNCTPPGDGVLDFSYGDRATLDESSLSETAGICSGVDVDWNQNTIINGGLISFDINRDGSNVGDGVISTLTDWDDWGNLYLNGISDGDGAPVLPIEIVTEDPVPLEYQN